VPNYSSRSLDIQFSSSRVPKAVLSTVNSIQVECPSRRSLDSRFNSGRVPEAVLSTIDSIQVECPSRRSLDSSEFSSLLDALLQYAFLERRYRCICIMQPSSKGKKKGDALYYVRTQTQCIYTLCYLWGSLTREYKA
jgi:hypothetical protein